MQVSFIQHSTMDPEKSTVRFEPRIETRANALYSPGGTMTFPDCEVPVGFVGVKRVTITASCSPPDALPMVYPTGCAFAVVNCSVPGWPSPVQLPPVTSTASGVPVPAM